MTVSTPQVDKIKEVFERNFAERGELGASVSVWRDGEEILNLAQGWCDRTKQREWTADTMVPVYSATKGPASAILLMLLEENGLTPQDLVVRVWDEFPNKNATFAELMSHQSGFAALDKKASVFDYGAVIEAVEQQAPNWPLGDGHGYHPRTYGFLLEKPVRELSGKTLGEVWRERVAEPLGLDFWIGLPESEFGRVATLYPGKMDKSDLESGFYKEFNQEGTLVRKAFGSPRGLHAVQEMNKQEAWQAALPAMGGVGTARALAKFYQAAIGRIECFSHDVLEWIKTPVIQGEDRILRTPTRFTCGFQMDPLDDHGSKLRHNYGAALEAFGHPGAGGSHALGDPESGVSFAYIMNQMELAVLPGPKSLEMIAAI
ncbi:CubicO group peptidase, beta-lactamase class C family [Rubritalea squalenifaciens DSM 18772]|uniref:CubicO group peptidase, beta-lactamase class C family n=1 Tax=Rubritalea squalenifaciens DSM 18772 TaxID=1123071 RepID=A0A1M6RZ51_9BACT|nr:CubicO group peptidase, beta-lactamase class C family [Rubritalea squalenifaciens DSM 18772]